MCLFAVLVESFPVFGSTSLIPLGFPLVIPQGFPAVTKI